MAGTIPSEARRERSTKRGFRVPMLAKWPNMIEPGVIVSELMSAEDWMPTLVAAAGEPDLKKKLLTGYKAGDKTFKNHLDGY